MGPSASGANQFALGNEQALRGLDSDVGPADVSRTCDAIRIGEANVLALEGPLEGLQPGERHARVVMNGSRGPRHARTAVRHLPAARRSWRRPRRNPRRHQPGESDVRSRMLEGWVCASGGMNARAPSPRARGWRAMAIIDRRCRYRAWPPAPTAGRSPVGNSLRTDIRPGVRTRQDGATAVFQWLEHPVSVSLRLDPACPARPSTSGLLVVGGLRHVHGFSWGC